jgi:hypothetical protein
VRVLTGLDSISGWILDLVLHIKQVQCHYGMARPHITAVGDCHQIQELAANAPN